VPIRDEAQAKRREQMAQMIRPDQPAKLAVALVSSLAKDVSGQIFGARGDTIELYSQPRPIVNLRDALPGTNDQALERKSWSELLLPWQCAQVPCSGRDLFVQRPRFPHRRHWRRFAFGFCRRTHHRSRLLQATSE